MTFTLQTPIVADHVPENDDNSNNDQLWSLRDSWTLQQKYLSLSNFIENHTRTYSEIDQRFQLISQNESYYFLTSWTFQDGRYTTSPGYTHFRSILGFNDLGRYQTRFEGFWFYETTILQRFDGIPYFDPSLYGEGEHLVTTSILAEENQIYLVDDTVANFTRITNITSQIEISIITDQFQFGDYRFDVWKVTQSYPRYMRHETLNYLGGLFTISSIIETEYYSNNTGYTRTETVESSSIFNKQVINTAFDKPVPDIKSSSVYSKDFKIEMKSSSDVIYLQDDGEPMLVEKNGIDHYFQDQNVILAEQYFVSELNEFNNSKFQENPSAYYHPIEQNDEDPALNNQVEYWVGLTIVIIVLLIVYVKKYR